MEEAEQARPVPMPGRGSARTTGKQIGAQMLGRLTPFPGQSFTASFLQMGCMDSLWRRATGKAQAGGLGGDELPSPPGPGRSCVSPDDTYYSFPVPATAHCEACRVAWQTRRRSETRVPD